ncbi:hypothetical protein ACS0TY_009175 [Phlomoides rotata]
MESEEKVEMIKKAITKLLEEEEENEDSGNTTTGRRRRHLLNKLMSELEWLEEESEVGNEEIMKEVRNVKRQNSITHHLVVALIVITVAWQYSEVSLILKIKHGFSNPFKSLGGMLKGFLKGGGGQDVINAASDVHKHLTQPSPTYLPGELKIPGLPTLDLPGFDTTGEDDDD